MPCADRGAEELDGAQSGGDPVQAAVAAGLEMTAAGVIVGGVTYAVGLTFV